MNYEIYDAITRTTKTNESGKAILADPIITEDGAAMDEIYDTNGFNVASWLSNLEDLIFDAHGNVLIKYSRLRELCDAERGGRLVVLPCKVGDSIFIDEKHISYAEAIKQMELLKYGVDRHAPRDSVIGVQDKILRTRAINKAISSLSALRAREQNEPLTYDELITMSGQHVFFKQGKYTNWILLDYDNGVLNYYMFIHSGTITRDTVKNSDTYRFYRYEPKGAHQ